MQTIKIFFATLFVCFSLDMVWLGLIAKKLYSNSIGDLLRTANGQLAPNWVPAILVYFAIAIGIVFFALPKANHQYSLALFWGAALGLVIYGVYDFTNYSLLANWPLNITLTDFLWGMVLCGLTNCFATFIQNWLAS